MTEVNFNLYRVIVLGKYQYMHMWGFSYFKLQGSVGIALYLAGDSISITCGLGSYFLEFGRLKKKKKKHPVCSWNT